MTGPVEFLEAAHQRAEETAQAARDREFLKRGRWSAQGPYCDNQFGILVSDEGEHITGDGDFPWPFVAHFALHDPAAVLRRVAAERALLTDLLAEPHEVVEDCWYTCAAATEERDGGETCRDFPDNSPCDCGRDRRVQRRVRMLAEAWGWTEEQ